MRVKKGAWKSYAAWILFTEAVGAFAGALIREGVQYFECCVNKPPLTPPGAVFPVVWGILYALMGVSAARIYMAEESKARSGALRLYMAQLFFNFFWSIIFFMSRTYGAAFVWLTVLWVLIVRMLLAFRELEPWTARLQIPYLVWVFFAGYLNFGVWMLN